MSGPPPRTAAGEAADPLDLLDRLGELLDGVRAELGRAIVGQRDVIDQLLVALLAGGHVLIEGVPGLAKTLIVHSLADTLSLRFGRIQFTPDLMPGDVTGTVVVQDDPRGGRSFSFRPGPVFVNVLLADEINRTPPKTQAALLEAMQEGHTTAGGTTHELPHPFFVLATQNSLEQEGTYPLPEAQLDRFLLHVEIGYPEEDEETEVVRRTTGPGSVSLRPVLERQEILALQEIATRLPVAPHVREYATRLARASRPSGPGALPWVRDLVAWGAGPRGAKALIRAAAGRTLLDGRWAVTRGDVRAVAYPVLRHRILPGFRAEGEGLSADQLIERLLSDVPPFRPNEDHDDLTRRVLRL